MNYEDYFRIEHIDGEVTMDEFISAAMRSDIKYDVSSESIDELCSVRNILRDEILTCYQFMKEQGMLQKYHDYRG